ncbi:MAG: hypothetical protein ACK5LL_03615 [Suipraeoptans sp.]
MGKENEQKRGIEIMKNRMDEMSGDLLCDLMGRKMTLEERGRAKELPIFMLMAAEQDFENYSKEDLTEDEFDSVIDELQRLGCSYLLKSFLNRQTT